MENKIVKLPLITFSMELRIDITKWLLVSTPIKAHADMDLVKDIAVEMGLDPDEAAAKTKELLSDLAVNVASIFNFDTAVAPQNDEESLKVVGKLNNHINKSRS